MLAALSTWFSKHGFFERLTARRNVRRLKRLAVAKSIDLEVLPIGRYESRNFKPTLDVIRRLAGALRMSLDALVFDECKRGPDDVPR